MSIAIAAIISPFSRFREIVATRGEATSGKGEQSVFPDSRRNRYIRLFLLASLLAAFVVACSDPPPLVKRESFVFGTRVEVLVAGVEETIARAAINAALADFDALHHAYHAWQPSQLSEVNAAIAAGKPIEVSAEMADFILDAQDFAHRSRGLFDPGIGRLVALWGFQTDEFVGGLPDEKALDEWRQNPASISHLRLDDKRQLVSTHRGVALDFGGYLKGVALDRAAEKLKAKGIENALINIGGNVMALGDKNGQPWKIGIQHPRQPDALAILDLYDGEAIGTSGDYQRYFELDGRLYSHLLDPASGEPVRHTRAVTILISPLEEPGKTGARSDVLSKPLFLAGADNWREVARELGVTHVLRVDANGDIEVSRDFMPRLTFPQGVKPTRILP
ncbi:MAG: FAD:protein FMN transferase [Betaproteobacteria bacterium]|nr:FAD:protein FMN transferase [Betaproteobacteria bacterium]